MATNTWAFPDLKSSRDRDLTNCDLLLCIAKVLIPSLKRYLVSLSAPCLVLTNTKT